MSGILFKNGQTVRLKTSQTDGTIEAFLGSGGQGEVWKVKVGGNSLALKWYYSGQATEEQRMALEYLVQKGLPSDRFLWPLDLVTSSQNEGYGYVMPLRPPTYKNIVDLMKGRITPTFRALAKAGFQLAFNFGRLHLSGLCYADISFGNVFFDPQSGDILICDNDNVRVNKSPCGVKGTIRFIAPEVVRDEALPSIETDRFSLAVLLFYMLMVAHPLDGKRESSIRCLDEPAMSKLYGSEPKFIWDPNDESNRPDPERHQNAIEYWKIYPEFLKKLFTRTFTDGIRDPINGRVTETEWQKGLIRLQDSSIYCFSCCNKGTENFYDAELVKQGAKPICWNCKKEIPLPFRIRLKGKAGETIVMLNHDAVLFPHHLEGKDFDFSKQLAEVSRHPQNPSLWGLKNLSGQTWTFRGADDIVKEVEPGKNLPLNSGIKINFGQVEGEVKYG
jgi:eukaryotic-like serine/threonine-protein kinase